MRLLGARNAGAAPPTANASSPSAGEIPPQMPVQALTAAPVQATAAAVAESSAPAVAVASAPGPQGLAAVGWRVSLPFAGGFFIFRVLCFAASPKLAGFVSGWQEHNVHCCRVKVKIQKPGSSFVSGFF